MKTLHIYLCFLVNYFLFEFHLILINYIHMLHRNQFNETDLRSTTQLINKYDIFAKIFIFNTKCIMLHEKTTQLKKTCLYKEMET